MKINHNLFFWTLALIICTLMIPSRSFWMDEAFMTPSALQPTIIDWWNHLQFDPISESLKPLYLLICWISAKTIGTSEWAFRSINIFWTLTAAVFLRISIPKYWGLGIATAFLLHPYVWHQASEARPYSMQLACGAAMAWAIVKFSTNGHFKASEAWILAFALMGVYGSSLLGAFAVFAFAVVLTIAILRKKFKIRACTFYPILCTVIFCIILSLHYLRGLSRGQGGAVLWPVGPMNIVAVAYEFLGFAGLGPPREELRTMARQGFEAILTWKFELVMLLLAIVVIFATIALGFNQKKNPAGNTSAIAYLFLFALLACALSSLSAFIKGWPFWGRHLAFAFPALFLCCALWLKNSRYQSLLTYCFLLIIGIWTFSSMRLRYVSSYLPEDNRSAASLTRSILTAEGSVWWVASPQAAFYYINSSSSILGEKIESGKFRVVLSGEDLETCKYESLPDIVVLGRQDTWDANGLIREFIKKSGYISQHELSGRVSVWQRK
jgi:hypothetical protein